MLQTELQVANVIPPVIQPYQTQGVDISKACVVTLCTCCLCMSV